MFKERYVIAFENAYISAQVSGRFHYIHFQKHEYPQVGDYVNFRIVDEQTAIIEEVKERHSVLEREDAGQIGERQILAANVDLVFICMSLNEDFNTIKLRNFLTLTYQKPFETIILLTKKDLCHNEIEYVSKVQKITELDILTYSALDPNDLPVLKQVINGKTTVFIGSSGVGKSTIINQLMGEEHFKTQDIRLSDAQGRHTTVHRELIDLGQETKVIDTPGIRIVSSYFVSESAFEDIKSLSEGCRFDDCSHKHEPGCMVQQAIRQGVLDEERYHQYRKAMKLNAYHQKRELERSRLQQKRTKKGR